MHQYIIIEYHFQNKRKLVQVGLWSKNFTQSDDSDHQDKNLFDRKITAYNELKMKCFISCVQISSS